ncbi:MAG: hypothetical protein ABJA67_06715 [Chthonomonadales bacterium]
MQFKRSNIFVASLLSTSLLAGCGGGGGTGAGDTSNQFDLSFTRVNDFKVQPTLAILPTDGSVTIKSFTDTSVTLSGAVPALKAGSTILSNAKLSNGVFGLLRKVVSVAAVGGDTVVQTTQGDLADVFQTANIHQATPFPNAAFAGLKPAMTGVSFGPTRSVPGSKGRDVETTLPISFNSVFIQDSGGRVIAELNGEVDITVGMETNLELDVVNVDIPFVGKISIPKGVNSMLAAPYIHVGGPGVKLTSRVKGGFSKRIGISDPNNPIEWDIPIGPIGLNVKVGLFAAVDADYDGTGDISFNGSIDLEAGVGVGRAVGKSKNQFGTKLTKSANFDVSTQGIFPHGHLDINTSILQGEISVGVAGLGSAFIRADALRGLCSLDYAPVNGKSAFNYHLKGELKATIGAHLKLLGLISLYDGEFTPLDYVFDLHNWYSIDTGQQTAPDSIPGQQTGNGNIGIILK